MAMLFCTECSSQLFYKAQPCLHCKLTSPKSHYLRDALEYALLVAFVAFNTLMVFLFHQMIEQIDFTFAASLESVGEWLNIVFSPLLLLLFCALGNVILAVLTLRVRSKF